MYKAILVSDANSDRLNRLLERVGMVVSPLTTRDCVPGAECAEADFAVVVQDGDGRGAELSLKIAACGLTVVFVATRHLPSVVADKLSAGGVCVLDATDDEAAEMFFRQLFALRAAIEAMRRENAGLRKKVAEAQAVGRAKCLLVERRNMTEQSAHKFIEKTAMDNRLSRYAVAENIITGYEKRPPNGISA